MAATPQTYHRVLVDHKEGETMLEDLVGRFDAQVSFVPGELAAERLSTFRDGQRSVIRWLLETVAAAQAGEQKFPRILGR